MAHAKLYFEMKLVDDYGRVHGVVRREIDDKAAFMGQQIADDLRAGPIGGFRTMDEAVEVLRVKEFRRHLLKAVATQCGGQLADFLEDREGWHGLDRQERTDRIAAER